MEEATEMTESDVSSEVNLVAIMREYSRTVLPPISAMSNLFPAR